MKKLNILAAILAMGTMCITGCNMGGPDSADTATPHTSNIALQEEKVEEKPAPAPDDNCKDKDNCNRGKMPFKKPGFKFKVPQVKHDRTGRDTFRRPHKKPTPNPENPETPALPEDNGNN